MKRAFLALSLLVSVHAASHSVARAQTIELRPECASLASESARLRTLVQVEATSFDAGSLDSVRIELAECSTSEVTVLVHRDDALLDARHVDLDDAAAGIRMRLVAYVVAEILLASPIEPVSTPTVVPASTPAQADAPRREDAEAAADPGDATRVNRDPDLRPWHITLDAGVRWFPTTETHLGTYRLTMSIGRMLFEARHAFGPVLGRSDIPETGARVTVFHVATIGLGFRYRYAFGDDALFVDGLGAVGFLFLDGERTNFTTARETRYAVAGLEARAGIEIGFGRVRGLIAVEFGYLRPRNGPKSTFAPPPEVRTNGRFLGMTVGLGWETVSGLRHMESRARRRLLGATRPANASGSDASVDPRSIR